MAAEPVIDRRVRYRVPPDDALAMYVRKVVSLGKGFECPLPVHRGLELPLGQVAVRGPSRLVELRAQLPEVVVEIEGGPDRQTGPDEPVALLVGQLNQALVAGVQTSEALCPGEADQLCPPSRRSSCGTGRRTGERILNRSQALRRGGGSSSTGRARFPPRHG